jgi:hypothetical protein
MSHLLVKGNNKLQQLPEATVLLGIESHRVFSYGCGDLPVYRFGGKLEGKAQ